MSIYRAAPLISPDSPLFTVVIPVYNRAWALERTIRSVLAQSFVDYEIIVVDDGSNDDPGIVCDGIDDVRLRFIRQENGGASSARNTGIDAATGRYVAFLDSDDFYLHDHLEQMAGLVGRFPNFVIYSPVVAERGNGSSIVKPPRAINVGENMADYLMRDRGFVQTSGLCVPVGFARRVRYREDAVYGDDTDFAIRLQLAGCNFVMNDRPTVIWSDGIDYERLSDVRTPLVRLDWLEDLRKHIPYQAYVAYRGWHLAKSLARQRPLYAVYLYLVAVLNRAYSLKLALVVLLQIILPSRAYRRMTDVWIKKLVRRGTKQ